MNVFEGLQEYLSNHTPVWFVTLNSGTYLPKGIKSIESLSLDFDRQVSKTIKWIIEYLFGKNKDQAFRAVSFKEVAANGNLHCHIIIGLSKESRIDTLTFANYVNRKWKRFLSKRTNGTRDKNPNDNKDPKFLRFKSKFLAASCSQYFEYELDRSSNVKDITCAENAWGYSTKQFIWHMASEQHCSYTLY